MDANLREELARVEAVLFAEREPTSSRKLAKLAGIEDGSRARLLAKKLNDRYARVGAAFCVVEAAGGFQLRTLPEFAPWLSRLQQSPGEAGLSNSAMETLTIVAYEQPCLRATVERARGARCGDALRQLLEKGLIKIVGRSEDLGRPFLYGTTKRFLQTFGFVKIEDLPKREEPWITKDDVNEAARILTDADNKAASELCGGSAGPTVGA
ncbi:MAG: SMC-Scp complex subunit ScpB [Thermoguttaceae bacterium]|nr:SMC-Scp complex subunit ScpB [Thermoguttaceae bacterium]